MQFDSNGPWQVSPGLWALAAAAEDGLPGRRRRLRAEAATGEAAFLAAAARLGGVRALEGSRALPRCVALPPRCTGLIHWCIRWLCVSGVSPRPHPQVRLTMAIAADERRFRKKHELVDTSQQARSHSNWWK